MNAEFFSAIEDLEKEKGIPREYMYDKIKQAMLAAFRRDNPECADNVEILLDESRKRIEMYVNKVAVEQVEDKALEIDLEAAKKITKRAKVGDTIKVPVETKKFGRIAAQAAKQVIIQGLREAERGMVYDEFNSKQHEILTGTVHRIDPRGTVHLRIGSGNEATEGLMGSNEQVPGEELTAGQLNLLGQRQNTEKLQKLLSDCAPLRLVLKKREKRGDAEETVEAFRKLAGNSEFIVNE